MLLKWVCRAGTAREKETNPPSFKILAHHSCKICGTSVVNVKVCTPPPPPPPPAGWARDAPVCLCDAFLLPSISPYISKVHNHFWLKFGMEPSIYGALMLLNFCGDWGRGLGARTKLLGVSN